MRVREHTRYLRGAWRLLVRSQGSETLEVSTLTSWERLWGRFGVSLYRCFESGDAHIQAEMILLARRFGGWRGQLVADRLERWQHDLLG